MGTIEKINKSQYINCSYVRLEENDVREIVYIGSQHYPTYEIIIDNYKLTVVNDIQLLFDIKDNKAKVLKIFFYELTGQGVKLKTEKLMVHYSIHRHGILVKDSTDTVSLGVAYKIKTFLLTKRVFWGKFALYVNHGKPQSIFVKEKDKIKLLIIGALIGGGRHVWNRRY